MVLLASEFDKSKYLRAEDLKAEKKRKADELSQQYYLGYSAAGKKDGRWH